MSDHQFEIKKGECNGVIFDKDGTILDSIKIWPELIKSRVEKLREEFNFKDNFSRTLMNVMGLNDQEEIILRSPIVIGSRGETAAAVCGLLFLHLGVPWDLALMKVNEAFNISDKEVPLEKQAILIPGIRETMQNLVEADYKIGIATNDNVDRTRKLMGFCGLEKYISGYACRDEVLTGKPEPEMFRLICQRLNLKTTECIIVGDSPSDIYMGIKGGAKFTVGVLTGASKRSDLAGIADIILPSAAHLNVI